MLNAKLPQNLSDKLLLLNWKMLAAKALIVLLVLAMAYFKGSGDGKAACEKKHAKDAKHQLDKVVAFAPIADKQTAEAVAKEAKVTKKKEVYDAQVNSNDRPASCGLTPDELRAFQELVQG